VLALGLLVGCGGADRGSGSGPVTNVVDGDTIDVEGMGRIRVVGIDTPERGACGYESATLAMATWVEGREVVLVPGAADDADRYGRLLRYVEVDGVDVGLELIRDGWAIARYDSRDGYGRHPREDAYVAADLASPDRGCYPDNEP
jgi:micrococcal nuclease